MDEAALDAAQEELVAWGLLERGPQGLAWSRRFRGAVMREAARLAEEERAQRKPEGHPLANAVRGALRQLELPAGAAATSTHEQLLFAVELAGLPEPVREFLGP
jgi:hypothetical protein